jgi:hypothetical protein
MPALLADGERRRAVLDALLQRLLEAAPADRLAMALAEPSVQPVDLLEESEDAQPGDPERSIVLAAVAADLTAHRQREDGDEVVAALYFTRAAVLEGNAYRLQGDLVRAETAGVAVRLLGPCSLLPDARAAALGARPPR